MKMRELAGRLSIPALLKSEHQGKFFTSGEGLLQSNHHEMVAAGLEHALQVRGGVGRRKMSPKLRGRWPWQSLS
jgi:hypothetical protein